MDLELTDDQKAFIQEAIESGRFNKPEDALREALSLWEARERKRAEILSAIDSAEASLARDEGLPLTQESTHDIVEQVKARGRRRLEKRTDH